MKKMLIEWKKPVIKSATFEEISEYVKAMARSGGMACVSCSTTECISCSCASGSCACAAACNPTALYWSCGDFFIIVGKTPDEQAKK